MIRYWLYRLGRFRTPILFVGLAWLVRWLLEPVLHGKLPHACFYAAIVLTAWNAGFWESLTAVVLGWLAAEWFFIEPGVIFSTSPEALLGDGIYFFTGLAILWFRHCEQVALDRALSSAVKAQHREDELEAEKASQREARTVHELLAHIVETSQDAIFTLTTDGRIVTWNTAAAKLLGYTGQEAIGQPPAFILPPEERLKAEQILGTLQRGQPTEHWQTALNRKDGTAAQVSLTAASARDAQGKVIGVSVIARPRV